MDFAVVFKFLVETLRREKIDFALIGGFALQAEGVTRIEHKIKRIWWTFATFRGD